MAGCVGDDWLDGDRGGGKSGVRVTTDRARFGMIVTGLENGDLLRLN